MFEILNNQTGAVLSNQTAEQVADYLRGEGALQENSNLRMDDERTYENPVWQDTYRISLLEDGDANKAFHEVNSMI